MTCPKCKIEAPKAGKRPDGMQRFRCGSCGKTFSESKPQNNLFQKKQAVDDRVATLVLQLLVEGNSIRSTERITGIHRDTIMGLLLAAGQRCQALMAMRIKDVPVKDVQCDEIWTFVQKKEKKRTFGEKDFHFRGDAWTYIAVERGTKLILAFDLAKRNTMATQRFMKKLAEATSAESRFQLSSDGWVGYNYAVGMELEERCDYGQLIKIFAQPSAEESRRYSPSRMVESRKTPVYGNPDEARICTSHVERQNGSLRLWCKRLTRLTYAFSKSWENLRAALALHFAFFNFCRVHSSIKQTPAMASGLADRPWTMADLLAAA